VKLYTFFKKYDILTIKSKIKKLEAVMLKSLLKGVGMGAGMGVGQELTSAIIQGVKDKRSGGNNNLLGNNNANSRVIVSNDVKCSCGEFNTSESKFCGACGNSLVQRYDFQAGKKCSCGFLNAQGQRFCSECGNKL
jgi:hypothetical protein